MLSWPVGLTKNSARPEQWRLRFFRADQFRELSSAAMEFLWAKWKTLNATNSLSLQRLTEESSHPLRANSTYVLCTGDDCVYMYVAVTPSRWRPDTMRPASWCRLPTIRSRAICSWSIGRPPKRLAPFVCALHRPSATASRVAQGLGVALSSSRRTRCCWFRYSELVQPSIGSLRLSVSQFPAMR